MGDARAFNPVTRVLCPHCQSETAEFWVTCDGHPFAVWRCFWHGDIVPKTARAPTAQALRG